MEVKARLKRTEHQAPKNPFAMKDKCITSDEIDIMRKIDGPDASASLDDHFPRARRVGLEVRHSGDAP